MSAVGREERVLQIIETARSKRPRFKDEQITLAHGAGGKASSTLIEGLLAPALLAAVALIITASAFAVLLVAVIARLIRRGLRSRRGEPAAAS